ncbi:hypothetical protein BGX27_002118, partial [Mortierella sp. AM989]
MCGAKISKKQATRHYDSHQARKDVPTQIQANIPITLALAANDLSEPLAERMPRTLPPMQTDSTIVEQGDSTTKATNSFNTPSAVVIPTASSIAVRPTYNEQNPRSTTRPPDQEVDGQRRLKRLRTLLRNDALALTEDREEKEAQKRHILQALRGDLAVEMMFTTARCARLLPYVLHGPGDMTASFMTERAAKQLQVILPHDYTLSIYPLCNSNDISNHPAVPDGYEDVLNRDHIEVLTQGGTPGMERLVGAIIATGDKQIKVICTEHFLRDKAQDPHAESLNTHHTSVPDDQTNSQYLMALKIVIIPDLFNNPHLAIGTSAGNYLITSSEEVNRINVGPGRCGAFKVSQHTRLLISRERQDQSLLDDSVFGLAQVRTGFGHPTTYTTRRAVDETYNDMKTMPVTVFTLHLWGVQGAKVFHQLYVRSLEKRPNGIILKKSDVDDSPPAGKVAEHLADLLELFMDNELNVTTNPKATNILQALAKYFSKVISDKNRVIAENIEKRMKSIP